MTNITCHPKEPFYHRSCDSTIAAQRFSNRCCGCVMGWLLGILVLTGCVPSESDTGSVRVLSVIDGDTVVTTQGTVRLLGIDAPEHDECGYEEATRKLTELLYDKQVKLIADPLNETRDKYGRLLRYVEVSGEDVGELLLSEGYSELYPWFPFERLKRYKEKAPGGRLVGCD